MKVHRMPRWQVATVPDAKTWLRGHVDEGALCPCCGQLAKVYRRKLNTVHAHSLVLMWRAAGMEWQHVPTTVEPITKGGGEAAKLRLWGLIEEELERRPDGGRSGWWRITERGRAFVLGETTVPRFAVLYDNRCLGVEGERIDIREALGDKFDYGELMGLLH